MATFEMALSWRPKKRKKNHRRQGRLIILSPFRRPFRPCLPSTLRCSHRHCRRGHRRHRRRCLTATPLVFAFLSRMER